MCYLEKGIAQKGQKGIVQKTIVLVGLMGAGKTSLGKRLAKAMAIPFVDSDDEIEKASKMTISDIFQTYGEAHFRDREQKIIERLLTLPPMILAIGGGAFMSPKTRQEIQECALSIWIKVDIDTLVTRVSKRATRPLLYGKDPRKVLTELLEQRQSTYEQADLIFQSRNEPQDKTINSLIKLITRQGILHDA